MRIDINKTYLHFFGVQVPLLIALGTFSEYEQEKLEERRESYSA